MPKKMNYITIGINRFDFGAYVADIVHSLIIKKGNS